MDGAEEETGVVVPHDSLRPETLRAVIEEFVTREGTEYGRLDHGLDEKVEQVMNQLSRGDAHVTFDAETGSVSIVPTRRP